MERGSPDRCCNPEFQWIVWKTGQAVSSDKNCRGSILPQPSILKGGKLYLRQIVCCRKQFNVKLIFQMGTFSAVCVLNVRLK